MRMTREQVVALVLVVIVVAALFMPLGALGNYVVVGILIVGAVYGVIRYRARTPARQARPQYRDLLRKVGGDEAAANRLIAYERRRNPRSSEQQQLENAIWRLGHER